MYVCYKRHVYFSCQSCTFLKRGRTNGVLVMVIIIIVKF